MSMLKKIKRLLWGETSKQRRRRDSLSRELWVGESVKVEGGLGKQEGRASFC